MRRTFAMLALLVGVTTPGRAQRSWQTELGVQGGFTRMVAAGTGGDPTDAFSLPGFNLGNVLPSTAGVYVIIPWSQKLAVETDIAASQFNLGGTVTVLSIGLRGDYALTRRFYAAAGGALAYNNGFGNETQLGVQAALGYRHRLTNALNGRLEVRTTFYANAENAGPVDAYGVLVGVSTASTRGRPARSGTAASSRRAWTPQLGLSGGYANVHLVGTGGVTVLAFPGYGGALGNALGASIPFLRALTLPPTVFLIIPVGEKVAIEPAIDIHRFQESGQTDFSGNISARLDYAVHGGWYAALGGNLQYLKTTGVNAATRTGLNVAWGYRFPLTGALGGRVEMNYTMFGRNTDLALDPTNTFGLMFGATMPLR